MENQLHKLHGDWQALSGVLAGKAMPEEIVSATKMTIGQSEYVVDLAGNIDSGACSINPNVSPVRMEINGKQGPNAGKTYFAIVEFLATDEIRIAYDLSGTHYPESFDPTAAATNYVATFRKR